MQAEEAALATKRRPYYILAPGYTRKSAGIKVMHLLCHLLNLAGEEAYLHTSQTAPDLVTPRLNDEIIRRHQEEGRAPIAVYPEVTHGNPFNAPSVVRYILNHIGLLGGPNRFDDEDWLLYYNEEYASHLTDKQVPLLEIATIDTSIFNTSSTRNRTLKLVYPGRHEAARREHPQLFKGATVITYAWPESHEALADILRQGKILYTFANSMIVGEALLCGCPVVIMDSPFTRRPDGSLQDNISGKFPGVALGDSAQELAKARQSIGDYPANFKARQDTTAAQLQAFIQHSQTLPVIERAPVQTLPTSMSYAQWRDAVLPERAGAACPVISEAQARAFHVFVDAGDAAENAPLAQTLAGLADTFPPENLCVLSATRPQTLPETIGWAPDLPSALRGKAVPDQAWILCLKAGDQIDPVGARYLLDAALRAPGARLVYADEDQFDETGKLTAPQFKPDFDPDHLRSQAYIGRFLLTRADAFRAIAPPAAALNEAAWYDWTLRFFENFGAEAFLHLPEICFHARRQSDASPDDFQLALQAHLDRVAPESSAAPGHFPGSFRVQYTHADTPLVSIIIPTHNQPALLARCIESLTEKTRYPNYEIIVVDHANTSSEARAYLDGLIGLNLPQLRVTAPVSVFNYAHLNNLAASEAQGDYLLLLNDDTAIIDADWLDAMLNHAQRKEVGVVGAKLLYPDGRIQHAGMLLGLHGVADHPFIGEPLAAPGYGGLLMLDRQVSAVSGACMMIRKELYQALGGFNERDNDIVFADVDFCLRARDAGFSTVWTPHALLMHSGGRTLLTQTEEERNARLQRFAENMKATYARWLKRIAHDRSYNNNFRLKGAGFELESNPVFRPAPTGLKKLLAHNADAWGSGLYRMVAPATVLAEKGLIAGGCYGEYFLPGEVARIAPDVIVLQRQITDGQLLGARNYRSYSQAKLIFELDDYLPNIPHTNSAKYKMPADLIKRMRTAMGICDRIVVSTEPLRESMLDFHDEVVVIPNYLPSSLWGHLPARPAPDFTRKPRVGWAGGSSHKGDLRVITDVVRALADKVDWVFFGMKPEGLDDCIVEYHGGVPLGQYPAKLASLDLDLALAPLEDNFFNTCKSNLRLLELGICGYPMIATDLEPYRCGFPVTLVSNRFRDWVGAIEAKLANREALYEEGLALQSFVRSQWMLEGDNLLRWRSGWLLA